MIDAATLTPRLARPVAADERPFVGEERCACSGHDILCRAAAVAEALPAGGGDALAVRSSSPAFVLAAVLAAWQRRLEPLILDPNLKEEPAAVRRRFPALVTVTDLAPVGDELAVAGRADEPLEVGWPGDEQTAVLFFTSGSTGEPKVIRKLGRQLYRQLERELTWLGVEDGVSVLSMVPPFHILGFVYGLFLPMLGRGTTTYLHGAAPARWIDHLEGRRPDLVVGVPSHYRFLVNSVEGPLPEALYMSSGSPLSPAIHEAFASRAGRVLTQVYGSTETGGIAKRQGFGPWLPFPGLEWSVRAEDGRLRVHSPWQEDPEVWTVTDDLAEPGNGGFHLRGRADSVVKVGGKRFSTNEIIQIAQTLDGVENAVAVVYERYDENAVALFLTAAADGLEEAAVRRALAERLAPFKVPRTIRVLANLPCLANGKVDLERLKARAAAEAGSG